MTTEPKRTKRVRQQTAVLLTAIAHTIQRMEKARMPVSLDILLTDPEWIAQEKDLAYNKTLLQTTTDHYGAAKIKSAKSQGSRLIRAGCSCCGYTIRISAMWINCALPVCPNPDCENKGKPFEVDNIPQNTEEETFKPLVEKAAPMINEAADDPVFDQMVKDSEEFFNDMPKGNYHGK